jgi:PAS domain-containing protein
MESGVCVYPENVAALFPRDRFLKDEGISGYVGAAMKDRAGNPLGVMLALSRTPITKAEAARAVLEHFSVRVACAIDTAELIERQNVTIAAAADGVWDWDVVTGGTTLSDSVLDLLGLKKRGFYDLTHIENAIHPEDRPRYAEALRAHVSGGGAFSVAVRLNTAKHGWRWFLSRGEAMRNEKGRAVRMIGCFIDVDALVAGEVCSPRAATA